MTRLYINKQEVASLPPDLNSLEQVLELVETAHLSPNVVIRQIQIDGLPLIQEEQAASLSEPIHLREKIEIFTSTLQEVALDSIREAMTYLGRVEAAIPSLASGFRNRAGAEDFENLKQFYEGFYWVNLLVDRLERSFQVPLETLSVCGIGAREHHVKLASILREVIAAHEQKDFGLVADLLEYEISTLIPGCKELFQAVRSRILAQE